MSTEKQPDLQKAIDLLLVRKLPEELRGAWISITQEIALIESQGDRIQNHPALLDRMDEIMLTDEFILANCDATNEIMGALGGMDLQAMVDAAPKPGHG